MDFITRYRCMQSKTSPAKNKKEILPHKMNINCSSSLSDEDKTEVNKSMIHKGDCFKNDAYKSL